MTQYLVFENQDTQDASGVATWQKLRVVEARSSAAAIKVALDGDVHEGQYVAVPARSWKPVTVKVETKTALRFS